MQIFVPLATGEAERETQHPMAVRGSRAANLGVEASSPARRGGRLRDQNTHENEVATSAWQARRIVYFPL